MKNPMFVFDEKMADLVLEHCRGRLSLDTVPLDLGGYAAPFGEVLEGLIGPEGNDPAHVLQLFANRLTPGVVSSGSPRHVAFIPSAPTKASLLFDMVVSALSLHAMSWLSAAGAISAENQVLGVLADLAGLPAGAGGCFVSGGSVANLSALMVARDTAVHRGHVTPQPKIACDEESHSSVSKALRVLGVEPFAVPAVDHRLIGESLEAALASGAPGAADVVGVVATAGTTNAGVIDDLAGIGEVARRHNLWFHVDGAYGAGALFAPSARPLFDGIEFADSLVVDPHKWLFAPYDSAALLYRLPELAKTVHAQHAVYRDIVHGAMPAAQPVAAAGAAAETSFAEDPWNPTDYAFHLSRRARGLPLWFSLAVHGTNAYRDAVETVLANAKDAAELVRKRPYLELLRDPTLSIVLFRRVGWSRADYDAWSARVLEEQIAFVAPTTWEGEPSARLALLHPETTGAIVNEILDTMA